MQVDGRCHCGYVTFEAVIDPAQVSICHCTDCQMLTGSAFRVTAMARSEDVRQTANLPKLYTKTGANGRRRLQYFCPECGSPMFTTGEGEDAALWGIRVGVIRQRASLAPSRQSWCRSALAWVTDIGKLPGTETE